MLWLINRFVLVINLNMVWMKLYVDVNFMQFNIWYVDCDSWFDRRIFDSRFSRFFVNPKFKGYRLLCNYYYYFCNPMVRRSWSRLSARDRHTTKKHDGRRKPPRLRHKKTCHKILCQVSAVLFVPGRALMAAAVRCSLKSNLDLGQD